MDFKEQMKIISRLELEYGSLANVPADNPDLIKINKANHAKSIKEDTKKNVDKEVVRKAVDMVMNGFSKSFIAKKCRVSTRVIQRIIDENELFVIPYFRYRVLSKDKVDIYFTTLKDVGSYLFNDGSLSIKRMNPKLVKYKLELRKSHNTWARMAENSYYVIGDQLYQKKGLDSFKKVKRDEPEIKAITVKIPEEIYKQLSTYCRSAHKKPSIVVTEVMTDFLKKRVCS